MPKQPRTNLKWLIIAAVLITITGSFVSKTALARVTFNTIDDHAIVSADGRQISVSGPISITAGEKCELRVTVTQRTTGAVAEGHARLIGTGALVHWEITAEAVGDEAFDQGPATAAAIAQTTVRGQATDAHQWLVNITLVGE